MSSTPGYLLNDREAKASYSRSGGIDILRALFALWILFAHVVPWTATAQSADAIPVILVTLMHFLAQLMQPVNELHPAVVGFIVLSGFCIHRRGFRDQHRNVNGYLVRRAFRILPIYFVAMIAGVAGFLIAANKSPELARTLSGTLDISPLCLAAKATTLAAITPFAHPCWYAGNAPLGTVMVEIQLYLVYALAFVLIWRGYQQCLLPALAICFAATLVLDGIFFSTSGTYSGTYNWLQNASVMTYLPYWWIGVFFVNDRFYDNVQSRIVLIAVVWAVLTAILIAYPIYPVVAELRKLVFALLVGVLIRVLETLPVQARPNAARGLRAGYSLYALHAPLSYTMLIYGVPWWLVIISNIVLASASYLVVEWPLMERGRMLARSMKAYSDS